MRGVDPLRVLIYIAVTAAIGVRVTYWIDGGDRPASERPHGTASISGRVLDDLGAPVAHARVSVVSKDPAVGAATVTDASGAYGIQSLPAGAYNLSAEKDGYLGDRGTFLQRLRFAVPMRTIALADRQSATDVVVNIVRGAAISGTVYEEDGTPAIRRYVRVLRREPRFEDTSWIDAAPVVGTDGAGRFRVGSLAAGEYVVMAGFTEDGERRAYHPDAARVGDATPVVISTGEERIGIDVRASVIQTAALTGVVLGPRGPVAGATVDLTTRGGSEPDDRRRVTTTDSDGRFTFQRVRADEYFVSAHAQAGTWPGVADGIPVWGRSAVASDGRAPRQVTVTLAPGRVWSGRLIVPSPPTAEGAAVGSAPIALSPADGATRALIRSASRLAARISADGRFTFPSVPPGRFRLVGMHADGWKVASATAGGVDLLDSTLVVSPDDPLPELVVMLTRR